MQNTLEFLKAEVKASVQNSLATLVKAAKEASDLSDAMAYRLESAVTVLKGLGMDEELRLLVLLLTSIFGVKRGIKLPTLSAPATQPTTQVSPATQPEVSPRPGPVAAPPMSPKTAKVRTAPARVINGDLASKLGAAAARINLGPLAEFREVLGDKNGRGREHSDKCRTVLSKVLADRLLTEDADWALLVRVAKRNLFFSDRRGPLFLEQCPPDHLRELLLGEGGLTNLVEELRGAPEPPASAPYWLGFIVDLCVRVGKDAKSVLINSKHAVNHLRQIGFIKNDHWLARKVEAMRPKPATLPPPPPEVKQAAEQAADHDRQAERVQEIAEAIVGEEKPVIADLVFEQAMLESVGETPSNPLPKEEPDPLMAPAVSVEPRVAEPAPQSIAAVPQVIPPAKGSKTNGKGNRKDAVAAELARRAQAAVANTLPAETEPAVVN